jgi:hypothetical protein
LIICRNSGIPSRGNDIIPVIPRDCEGELGVGGGGGCTEEEDRCEGGVCYEIRKVSEGIEVEGEGDRK